MSSYVQQGSAITTAAVYQDPSISLNSNILAICVTSTTAAMRVFRIEATGTLTELVVNGLPAMQLGCVAVSPTGRYIFAGAAATGQPYSRLWKYNSTTGEFDVLLTSGSSATFRTQTAAWAPDESYVVVTGYSSANVGQFHILGFDNTTDTLYYTTGNYYVAATGLAYRGWAIRVSPDSNYIAFCMTNGSNGATQRSYIYRLNRTTASWSITETYVVPAANSGAYISWNADGSYLMIGRWASGVPNLQLVKQTGGSGLDKTYAIQGGLFTTNAARNPHYLKDNIFAAVGINGINYWTQTGDTVATTTTPEGLETISSIANVGVSDPISANGYVAMHATTTLRVYKAVSGREVAGTISFPSYAAEGTVSNPIAVISGYTYPLHSMGGSLNVPIAINGAGTFSVYTLQGSGGIFEAQYTNVYTSLYSMIASTSPSSYAEVDPVDTYGYSNLTYPAVSTDGLVNILSAANGDLIYPTYGILGFLNIIEMSGNLVYPSGYSINGEFYNLKEFSGDFTYPGFDVDASVKVFATGSGELVYSAYTIDAVVTTAVINGALSYPIFEVDGSFDVLYTEGSGELNYPEFEASANVNLIDKIEAEIRYPTFEVDGEVDVPLWSAGDLAYAGYSLNGEINVPIGIGATLIYPTFSTSGVIGIKVNINGDAAYPKFAFAGNLGFVLSSDGNYKFPLYQIEGYSGANPVVEEGPILYPVFGVNFNIENYYGVASDSKLSLESEGTVARTSARKNLFITEH